jgi:hypothetical protein
MLGFPTLAAPIWAKSEIITNICNFIPKQYWGIGTRDNPYFLF